MESQERIESQLERSQDVLVDTQLMMLDCFEDLGTDVVTLTDQVEIQNSTLFETTKRVRALEATVDTSLVSFEVQTLKDSIQKSELVLLEKLSEITLQRDFASVRSIEKLPSSFQISSQIKSLSSQMNSLQSQVEKLSKSKTTSSLVEVPFQDLLLSTKSIQETLDKLKTQHKDCKKCCTSVDDIVEGVCNSIVGETWYKWDSTSKYFPSIVFLFVETGPHYPKRAQLKTRLTSCSEHPLVSMR